MQAVKVVPGTLLKEPGIFLMAVAIENARQLQEGDDDWSYAAEPCEHDHALARIAIRDSDGEFVGYWSRQ